MLIAAEGSGSQLGSQAFRDLATGEIHIDGGRPGLLPLDLHGCRKPLLIHTQTLLLGNFHGQLQGKAVGVVKLKRLATTNLLWPRRQNFAEALFAPFQGVEEAQLLLPEFPLDDMLPLLQPGIG